MEFLKIGRLLFHLRASLDHLPYRVENEVRLVPLRRCGIQLGAGLLIEEEHRADNRRGQFALAVAAGYE